MRQLLLLRCYSIVLHAVQYLPPRHWHATLASLMWQIGKGGGRGSVREETMTEENCIFICNVTLRRRIQNKLIKDKFINMMRQ